MQSLSYKDRAQYIMERQNWLEELKENLAPIETKHAFLQEANNFESADHLNDPINSIRSRISCLKEELKPAQQDCTIDYITGLAFGKRNRNKNSNFSQHFAINITLIGVSQLVPSSEDILLPTKTKRLPLQKTIWNLWDVDSLPSGCKTKVLAICGRSSGLSTGILNGIHVNIDLEFKDEKKMEKNKKTYLTAYAVRPKFYNQIFASWKEGLGFVCVCREI